MAKVHMITLVSGAYGLPRHVGAYLDYNVANRRRIELEDLLIKHKLDPVSVRAAVAADEYDTTDHELEFINEAGISYVWASYTGIRVYLESYDLLG
jgi:hypothetical protein